MSTNSISEEARDLPVIHETDILVVGGACTGVFAAVRAARLGARVAVVEKQNCFGGVATAGLVNIWHSLHNEGKKRRIIAGLTAETIERLDGCDAVHRSPHPVDAFRLNTKELKIELDELVTEHGIEPFLHTHFSAPLLKDRELVGVVVENKSGRGAILAKRFVDASGDGDLARRAGCATLPVETLQPPPTCAKYSGMRSLADWYWEAAPDEHGAEYGLEPDWGWASLIPGLPEIEMHADSHVFNADLSRGDVLTRSEIEGRRKVRQSRRRPLAAGAPPPTRPSTRYRSARSSRTVFRTSSWPDACWTPTRRPTAPSASWST